MSTNKNVACGNEASSLTVTLILWQYSVSLRGFLQKHDACTSCRAVGNLTIFYKFTCIFVDCAYTYICAILVKNKHPLFNIKQFAAT